MPREDNEIAQKFTEVFSRKYNIYLGYSVEEVSKRRNNNNNGLRYCYKCPSRLLARLVDQKYGKVIDAPKILIK
jgi:hypothetical protein